MEEDRVWDELSAVKEGVVEQTQRLLRARVLNLVGADTPEAAFLEGDRMWRLNRYTQALEELRVSLGAEPEPHYLRLLQTLQNARLAFVRSLSLRPDFYRLFAYTVGKLR